MKRLNKKTVFAVLALLVCAALSFGLLGCGGNKGGGNKNPQVSLDVSEKTLDIGESFRLTATLTDLEGAVEWKTSDGAIASVSTDGQVTAEGEGLATVTAVVGEYSAACSVKVINPHALPTVTLDKTGAVDVAPNASFTVTATARYRAENVAAAEFWWAIDENDADGVVTVTPSADTASCTVSGVKFGSVTLNCGTVVSGIPVETHVTVNVFNPNVTLSVADMTAVGGSYGVGLKLVEDAEKDYFKTFTPAVTVKENGADVAAENLVWGSENEDIVTADNGVITAVGAGTARVYAVYNDNGVYFDVNVERARYTLGNHTVIEYGRENSFVLDSAVKGTLEAVNYGALNLLTDYDGGTKTAKLNVSKFNGFGQVENGLTIVTDVAEYETQAFYIAMIIKEAEDFGTMQDVARELGKSITDGNGNPSRPILTGEFWLGNDIDCTGYSYTCKYDANGGAYEGGFRNGVIDGKGHTVKGLTMENGNSLFKNVWTSTIKDISFTDTVYNAKGDTAFLTIWSDRMHLENVYLHFKSVRSASSTWGNKIICDGSRVLELKNVLIRIDEVIGEGKLYSVGTYSQTAENDSKCISNVVAVAPYGDNVTVSRNGTTNVNDAEFFKAGRSISEISVEADGWDESFWKVCDGIPVPLNAIASGVEIKWLNTENSVPEGDLALKTTGDFILYKLDDDAIDAGLNIEGGTVVMPEGYTGVFTVTAYAAYDKTIKADKTFAVAETVNVKRDTEYVGMSDISAGIAAYRTASGNSAYKTDYAYNANLVIDLSGLNIDGTVSAVKYDNENQTFTVSGSSVTLAKTIFGDKKGDVTLTVIAEKTESGLVTKFTNVTVPLVLCDFAVSAADDLDAMQYVADELSADTKKLRGNVEFAASMDGYIVLTQDIDYTGRQYKVTKNSGGWGEDNGTWGLDVGFKGTFDGRGYNIDALEMVEQTAAVNQFATGGSGFSTGPALYAGSGLFSRLAGATIKNVSFTNVKHTCGGGFITTYSYGATLIENVYIQIAQATGNDNVVNWTQGSGVFCARGHQQNLRIVNCVVEVVQSSGKYYAAGIFAQSDTVFTNVYLVTSGEVYKEVNNNATSSKGYTVYADKAAAVANKDAWTAALGAGTSSEFWEVGTDGYFTTVNLKKAN